jgi:diguanylate cyclase (GGDEF)-like protein
VLRHFNTSLARWKKDAAWAIALSLLLWATISALDQWITIDLGLSIFYVLPVALATWRCGRWMGLLISLMSTASWFWADIHGKAYDYALLPYWNAGVRLVFFLIIHQLLLALQRSYRRQQQLADTDSLTGLYNRRYFVNQLQVAYLQGRRYGNILTLAYLDLDNFKQVNDLKGHARGDAVLVGVVNILVDNMRAIDCVARLGGDEFALLLPRANAAGAKKLCDRLHQALEAENQRQQWQVGFSIGVVTWQALPPSTDLMMQTVDRLMYEAKHQGKNHVQYRIV